MQLSIWKVFIIVAVGRHGGRRRSGGWMLLSVRPLPSHRSAFRTGCKSIFPVFPLIEQSVAFCWIVNEISLSYELEFVGRSWSRSAFSTGRFWEGFGSCFRAAPFIFQCCFQNIENQLISEQFRCNFRATRVKFQCSFRAIFRPTKCKFECSFSIDFSAISEPFQSNFQTNEIEVPVILRCSWFQSNFSAVSGQFQSSSS